MFLFFLIEWHKNLLPRSKVFLFYTDSFILRDEGCVTLWFSKESPWTSSISITWELNRNADFQAAPQTRWIRIVGWSPEVYVPISPLGDPAVAKAWRTSAQRLLGLRPLQWEGSIFDRVLSVAPSKTIADLLIPLV